MRPPIAITTKVLAARNTRTARNSRRCSLPATAWMRALAASAIRVRRSCLPVGLRYLHVAHEDVPGPMNDVAASANERDEACPLRGRRAVREHVFVRPHRILSARHVFIVGRDPVDAELREALVSNACEGGVRDGPRGRLDGRNDRTRLIFR